jgi:hypothetical protein
MLTDIRMPMETVHPCHHFHHKFAVALQSALISSLHAGMHENIGFEAVTAVLMKVQVLWDVTVFVLGRSSC